MEKTPILNNINEKKFPKLFSTRFFVALISFMGAAIMFITRVNMYIAIVTMVTDTKYKINSTLDYEMCDTNINNYTQTNRRIGEFNWNPIQQSYVLGSFFWGYPVLQIVGGRMTELFGAKWIIGSSIFASGIINLLTPLIAKWNFVALIVSRVVLGLFQGLILPSFYCLFVQWIPKQEHSTFLPWLDAGVMFGTAMVSAVSGKMIDSGFMGGWPSAFYVSGFVALLWCILWVYYVTSFPTSHRFITNEELNYISQYRKGYAELNTNLKQQNSFPWITILSSVPFLAVVFAKLTYGMVFEFVMTRLPAYLQDVIDLPIDQNGYIFATVTTACAVSLLTFGYISDIIIRNSFIDKTIIRKLFHSISGFGMILLLISIPYAGCNKILSIVLLITCMLSFGASSGGFIPIIADMTNDYAGTAYGIMNTVCYINGFTTPYMVGVIINRNPYSITLWGYVFYLLSAIVCIGLFGFVCFGSAEPQYWKQKHDLDINVKYDNSNNLDKSKTVK